MPLPSTTTTASDSASRIAVGNCSLARPTRFNGRMGMSGSLPVELGEEKADKQGADLGRLGFAVHGSAELGRRRQTLRVPTEMLARHAHTGPPTVMPQPRLEVRAHRRVLLGERWIRQL